MSDSRRLDEAPQNDFHHEFEPPSTLAHMIGDDAPVMPAEQRSPLPKFQLFLVLLIQFAEPITGLVIYPFINQLVRETGITKGDYNRTGYYAGIIESMFFFAETVTVFYWGWLSDRIGRRPVLLLGPLGLSFAMLAFGLSTSFWPLVWARCFQGVFNGNIGVSKTVMVELTDERSIGDAFAMMPLMWSIGSTIAPILGGALSNPAQSWPKVFGRIEIFKSHRYFLPCLVSALIALFTFIVAFLGLKETRPDSVAHSTRKLKKIEQDSEIFQASSSTDRLLGHNQSTDYGTTTSSTHCPPSSTFEHPTLRSVLNSRVTQTVILNYLFVSFSEMAYSTLLPLVYSTKIGFGGLGFNPYQIGMIMGIWGFVNAFVQVNLLGRLIRKYGASRVYQVSYASFLICFLMIPISTHLAYRNGGVGVGVYLSIGIQLLFQFIVWMGYGAIHVVVAQTTPKPVLGSINGIMQMTGSAARTIAPTVGSSLFSISRERQLLGGDLVYLVLVAVVLTGIKFSLALPQGKKLPEAAPRKQPRSI